MERESIGTVSWWSDDEGWGVIQSPDTPGGCWAHFSVITGGGDERRSLVVGQVVLVDHESARQDGFAFRATRVEVEADPWRRWHTVVG